MAAPVAVPDVLPALLPMRNKRQLQKEGDEMNRFAVKEHFGEEGGKKMYTCDRCGCNYDTGEMRNGICIDCWETQQEHAEREKSIRKMMHQTSYQLMFDLNGGGLVPRIREETR